MPSRVIWKGAISFGLVHVPVGLYPASSESGVDFDWLDRRSMDPVGYKRVNKRTGAEIASADVVKGVKLDDGRYVVLSDDEIKAAYPKATQTIEIEAFVRAIEVPFVYLERPYYLEPLGKADKVYALLREAMFTQEVIAIARVVMHNKEHLAALIPSGPGLVLNTLRWAEEIRSWAGLTLPPEGKAAANLKASELTMAAQLIADMTETWQPDRYADTFTAAVRKLVAQRADAGATQAVKPVDDADSTAIGSNVLDLTELLKKSLGKRHGEKTPEAPAPVVRRAGKPAPLKAVARKRA